MGNKRVCDYISEAIQNENLSGHMQSGDPLRQEELADSLGYSRIPIREALQILESQGLVKRLATRHVVVADFSDDVIEEIYELLSDVEIKLIKAMMKSGVPLWGNSIEDMTDRTLNMAGNISPEVQFHETLIVNSHNEYFIHILENGLWCYIRFAVEETAAGRENTHRLELLSEITAAYNAMDIEKVKKSLRDYFKCLYEAVIKERADRNG